jgi:hypothetical protein
MRIIQDSYLFAPSPLRPMHLSRAQHSVAHADSGKGHTIVVLVSCALVVPYSAAIFVGGIKLTAIKILITLILPTILTLLVSVGKKHRRLIGVRGFRSRSSAYLRANVKGSVS